MNFFSFLNELRFTLYEVILLWIISSGAIYWYFSSRRKLALSKSSEATAVENSLIGETAKTKIFVDFSQLKNSIDEQIRTQQLYARPQLNIERLAQFLDIPVKQLSLLLRTQFHQNYFEFINQYRLMAAKERLISSEWAGKSVQEVYESVGFSSRSTFFTLFKKQEGITPAEYRLKHRSIT
ncbi:helix-turn-helix domain-containing protein [Cellvibrio sp. pealriver]|uniref:helix-turn-helix domain-containing protein n=1 Tax=Cellvibrio sp. pealriver TaxID=1622269 RepID=UPI00066FE0EB|nr:helix-turn-helix domain-containing protein [Cellvibrio sp. pealriver]